MISPVVAGNQSESSATHAFAAGTASLTSQPNGERLDQECSKALNPGTDLAAVVLMGPAATRFTRTPLGPRSRAQKRLVDSNADFATPIQSYTGQAYFASKVRPTMLPPADISGSAPTASALREYADACSAVPTSSHEASRKLNAPCGAKPIECSTPSR